MLFEFPQNAPDRVQNRFIKALFYRAFTQDLNPLLTLRRPVLCALGGGVSGHLDAREIVRRTTIGRQSANIWSFRHGSVNYIKNV